MEQATTDSAVIEKTLDNLVTVLRRVAMENRKKGIQEADTSNLKSADEIFVHKDRTKQTELVVEMKEKKKKKQHEKKALTEAEFLSQWEDNDRSVDTIFLPRSRGPIGNRANSVSRRPQSQHRSETCQHLHQRQGAARVRHAASARRPPLRTRGSQRRREIDAPQPHGSLDDRWWDSKAACLP